LNFYYELLLIINSTFHRFKYYIKNFRRSIAYFLFGFNNNDYDYESLFELMDFKLKRMYDELANDGIMQYSDLRSLKLCINLYTKFNYNKNVESVYSRWGKPELDKSNGHMFTIVHKKVTSPELRVIFNKELSAAHLADELRRKKYKELFFKIMMKYHSYWWS